MLMKCYSNPELGEQAEAWEKGSISLLHLSNGALLGGAPLFTVDTHLLLLPLFMGKLDFCCL